MFFKYCCNPYFCDWNFGTVLTFQINKVSFCPVLRKFVKGFESAEKLTWNTQNNHKKCKKKFYNVEKKMPSTIVLFQILCFSKTTTMFKMIDSSSFRTNTLEVLEPFREISFCSAHKRFLQNFNMLQRLNFSRLKLKVFGLFCRAITYIKN